MPPDDPLGNESRELSRADWQHFERCLDRLPAEMKLVIVLRHRDQLAFAEIAVEMQQSFDDVRRLWARAIERLRHELGGADG